jgi:hypothetical protein
LKPQYEWGSVRITASTAGLKPKINIVTLFAGFGRNSDECAMPEPPSYGAQIPGLLQLAGLDERGEKQRICGYGHGTSQKPRRQHLK